MKKNNRVLLQVPGTYRYLAATILLGTISGGLVVTQAYYLSRIINSVFLAAQTLQQVWPFMLILLVLILARALLTWSNSILTNRLAGRIKLSLRNRLLHHLFALGPAYIKGERSGELISTTIEGVEALDPYVSQYLPQVFLSIFVPTIILITVFYVDVPSGIILLIIAPLLPFLMALVGMMAGAETKRRWQALRLMSAHFLDVLQGLTTLKLLGCSETEEQQIRTARAFLKDGPIMIFDEATANLDTRTEREVIRAIHHVIQGRTTLMITHRLVGLEMADEILVIQAGRIRERGIHHDLLQAKGLYWKLWQIQNQMVGAQ